MSRLLATVPRPRRLARAAAACGAAAIALALGASAVGAVLWFGEGNGVPAGYSPKDFTIVQHDGLFHAFYIMSNPSLRGGTSESLHRNERRFGHSVSEDLATWTFVDSAFTVDSASFDRHHIWSPSIVRSGGWFWMFYTGVEDTLVDGNWAPHRTQIGLAWSSDLTTWTRAAAPILGCGPPDTPWADCSEGGLRDAFVLSADTSGAGDPGWWMFFVTQPDTAAPGYYDPLAFLVGAASGVGGDLTMWLDFGPNWSTYRSYQNPPSERTNKVESPHLYKLGSAWHLFFTGDHGIVYLTGASPVGDTPVHQGEWTFEGGLDEVSQTEFASETFRATWGDGSTEDYFATVRSIGHYRYEVQLRIFNPTPGWKLLADPLVMEEIRPLRWAVEEGETLGVYFHAELGSSSGSIFQTLTRPAPLEIWEADDSLGVRTWTRLDPESIGIPSVVHVATQYGFGDYGDSLNFLPTWVPDDDGTPDRLEIQFRSRGVGSGVVAVGRAGTGVTGAGDSAPRSLALRAGAVPGRRGATLRLEFPERARARLDLYDVLGRHVRSLLDQVVAPGTTVVNWDGRDHRGEPVSPGVTFALLRAGGQSARARVLTIP